MNMAQVKEQLHDIEERFNEISLRERSLALGAFFVVLFMLLQLLWLDPLFAQQKLTQEAISNSQQQLSVKAQELALTSQLLARNSKAGKDKELAGLDSVLDSINEKLKSITAGLIEADHLPRALEQVLATSRQLKLLSMQTLVPEKILLTAVKEGESPADTAGIYKHTVELNLQGSYPNVLHYLETLEGLSSTFYWDDLFYQVDHFPTGDVKLKVYTLTTDEGWLGVQ